MVDRRAEAFTAFRDALNQHFIPEGTLIKAFNAAHVAGLQDASGLAEMWDKGFTDGHDSASNGWVGTSREEFGGNFPRRNPVTGEERIA